MRIKQISVFVENKTGRLCEVINALAKANIDILALSMADTTDFGVLRMIVDDPDRAKEVLRAAGMIVKSNHVLSILVDDQPGALADLLDKLSCGGISVEYMYASLVRKQDKAMMLLRVDNTDLAEQLLG
ncbi:MAG: ACT domain-containing protein [Clostridiales bacterium]|nr:ACT domain-containing protein [Clostridiales bacterium]